MMIANPHHSAQVRDWTTALLLTCLFLYSTGAAAANSGKVVIAKGEVLATLAAERRTLKRGAELFEGDVVTTGAASRTQVRFVDSALLSLEENSELAITEYAYQDAGRPDNVVMRLSRGGFRTITGAVGKKNAAAYKVETPLASIGIRGTSYVVRLIGTGEDMILEVIVLEGVVEITTPRGTVRIGAGEDFQAARIQSDGSIETLRIDDPSLGSGGGVGAAGTTGTFDGEYDPVTSGAGDVAINPAEDTGEASSQGASDFESTVDGGAQPPCCF